MPSLRQRLRRPGTYLWILGLASALVAIDASRDPGRQWTSAGYVRAVRFYQQVGRPAIAPYVMCRYRPTCSEYSIAAVQKYGIVVGLELTVDRIRRCTPSVPLNTNDPVPQDRLHNLPAAAESGRKDKL